MMLAVDQLSRELIQRRSADCFLNLSGWDLAVVRPTLLLAYRSASGGNGLLYIDVAQSKKPPNGSPLIGRVRTPNPLPSLAA